MLQRGLQGSTPRSEGRTGRRGRLQEGWHSSAYETLVISRLTFSFVRGLLMVNSIQSNVTVDTVGTSNQKMLSFCQACPQRLL